MISSKDQMTGFHMKCNTGLKCVKSNTCKKIALPYLLYFQLKMF